MTTPFMPTVKCVSSCTACSSAVARCPVCLLSMIGSHIWSPASCKRSKKSVLTISCRITSLGLNYIVQTLVRRVSSAIVVGNLWTGWWTSSWISRLCPRISSREIRVNHCTLKTGPFKIKFLVPTIDLV